MYVKTNDFGLEWPVEVLPDVWEMPELHGFLTSVEIHTRMHGEGNLTLQSVMQRFLSALFLNAGPSQLDFEDADGTQATIPLSPSATPPRDIPELAFAHSTPANRRAKAKQPVNDEPVSVGYHGYSEDEEVDQPEPRSSRMSLQARGSNG